LVSHPFPLLAEGLELARDEDVHVLGGRPQAEDEIQLCVDARSAGEEVAARFICTQPEPRAKRWQAGRDSSGRNDTLEEKLFSVYDEDTALIQKSRQYYN